MKSLRLESGFRSALCPFYRWKLRPREIERLPQSHEVAVRVQSWLTGFHAGLPSELSSRGGAQHTFLHRHRVIQPMGVSPRGQLTTLQDAMCESMEGQLSSDPASDPD